MQRFRIRDSDHGDPEEIFVGAMQAPDLVLRRGPNDEPSRAVNLLAVIQNHPKTPAELRLGIGFEADDRFHENSQGFE